MNDPINEIKNRSSRIGASNRLKFRAMTLCFCVLIGLTGRATVVWESEPFRQLILFALYGLAYVIFIELSWHLFAHRETTIIIEGKDIMKDIKSIDTEKLWKKISEQAWDDDDDDKPQD